MLNRYQLVSPVKIHLFGSKECGCGGRFKGMFTRFRPFGIHDRFKVDHVIGFKEVYGEDITSEKGFYINLDDTVHIGGHSIKKGDLILFK